MRDVWLVARFEVLRAVRTWRALALLAIYAVASAGAAWLFVKILLAMENALARALQVPITRTPGAMLGELVRSESWRDAVVAMTGSPQLADHLVTVPPMALFYLWVALLLTPFFSASAAAECVAIDVASRAVRYELLRTGRLELVLGRFGGQLFLTLLGTVVSAAVVAVVATQFLVGQSAAALLPALLAYLPRAFAFAVPFVAVGVAASTLTASAAWARVLAIGAVAGSWVAVGVGRWLESTRYSLLADLLLPVLPQGWLRGLWEPGVDWLVSALALAGIGASVVAVGFARFARRDV
jgi:hypothetical protein